MQGWVPTSPYSPLPQTNPKTGGGIAQDGIDAFDAYCLASQLIGQENWQNNIQPKIGDSDDEAVATAALSLFDIMEALTTGLWNKLAEKKEVAKLAGHKKEFFRHC